MTTTYDYRVVMKNDVLDYIIENYTEDDKLNITLERDEFQEDLYETLWTEDSVTGNGSGSYTFNRYKAEQNLNGNLSLMVTAFKEFDSINQLTDWLEYENFEAIDVSIRCYLLSEIISSVLDELEI